VKQPPDRGRAARSMNHIVAMLLVAMNRNEEKTFWLLDALIGRILLAGTYSHNLEGCQVRGAPAGPWAPCWKAADGMLWG
jgi:hypothetical protein